MKYLKLSLLSVSLAALMLGCGTESDEPPLVPEVVSIEIDGPQNDSIHSIFIDGDTTQLTGIVTYSDGTDSSATYELDWESNDTDVISVSRLGVITAVANQGTAAVSASYRDNIYTTFDKNITIVSLTDVNISTEATNLNITYDDTNSSQAAVDINTTGSYLLQVNGTFEDSETIMAISSHRAWTSSNTTVATVDLIGLMTIYSLADQNGTADINISIYDEVNATLELNVSL